jgi:hypothetical protein
MQTEWSSDKEKTAYHIAGKVKLDRCISIKKNRHLNRDPHQITGQSYSPIEDLAGRT